MAKKVLVLSSSPRKGGNSDALAASFAKGAEESGNEVEIIYLREKQYGFCKGCLPVKGWLIASSGTMQLRLLRKCMMRMCMYLHLLSITTV